MRQSINRFTNIEIKILYKMNCDWCLSQQQKYEKIVPELDNSRSLKDLLGNDSRLRQTKESARIDNNKISLRRASDVFKSKLTPQFTPSARIQNSKPIYIQPMHQSFSHHQLPSTSNMLLPSQSQPQTMMRPISYPSITQFNPPMLKINQRIQRRVPNVKIMFTSPKPPEPLKVLTLRQAVSNQSNNFPKQSFNSYDNKQSTNPSQIQPLKVQFQQLGIPNATQKNDNIQKLPLIEIKQQERKTNSNNANSNSIAANMNVINNSTNVSTKVKVQKKQQFKGSSSYYGGTRARNSLLDNLDDEDPNRRNSLAKSLKGIGHLQDIRCKRTQSIADANDQDSNDQFSQVIIGSRDVFNKQNKLTNSQTQISERIQKIALQNKRQIIWENSRKQSLSEL